MASRESLSILDVLENLNTLVEADSLEQLEVTENGTFVSHKEPRQREIYWITAGANEETINAIRHTFRNVHRYLVSFYRKMKATKDQKKLIDGINTIMVLVGEAEKKLETFDTLFKDRIPKLEEYKNLQNFYRNHVIKESFREFAKEEKHHEPKVELTEEEEWEKEFDLLLAETPIEEIEGVHLLNDIELVKPDHLYDLFYIKNEAGHHFYSPQLGRNIKLACDFGEFAAQYFGDDPLLQIKNWEDRSVHILAKRVLKTCSRSIERFYKEALKYREVEIVASLLKATEALFLAANPRTQIRQFSPKGSHLYFRDFQLFLRDTLTNREYQRFLIYSPPTTTPFFADCLSLIHNLVFATFTEGASLFEVEEALDAMTKREDVQKTKKLSTFLEGCDKALRQVLAAHPSGPVFKALDIVREEEERKFDPLMLGNLPTVEGALKKEQGEIKLIRLPAPVIQEYIDGALIAEEFKAFLHASATKEKFHLFYFNFQDRTSWKEHARCNALEDLSTLAEFSPYLTVVTLAKETDFYNQQGVYHEMGDAAEFVSHFLEHLTDENTGYFFPAHLKKVLFPTFGKKLLETVHEVFFDQKEKLSLRERLDFIEIAYGFIELKSLETIESTHMTLTSKDGFDLGGTSSIALFAILAIGQGKKWSEEEFEAINRTLFGPTLLHRERAVHQERFERLHETVRILEEKKGFLKSFKPLFNKTTLLWEPQFYKEIGEQSAPE